MIHPPAAPFTRLGDKFPGPSILLSPQSTWPYPSPLPPSPLPPSPLPPSTASYTFSSLLEPEPEIRLPGCTFRGPIIARTTLSLINLSPPIPIQPRYLGACLSPSDCLSVCFATSLTID